MITSQIEGQITECYCRKFSWHFGIDVESYTSSFDSGITLENPISYQFRCYLLINATCTHCSFQSAAQTFGELDKMYELHSKTAGHRSDYSFYELDRKAKVRPS